MMKLKSAQGIFEDMYTKKIFLILGMILGLGACAKGPVPQLKITPAPTLSESSTTSKDFKLESRDLRTAQYVALVDSGQTNVLPLHATANLRKILNDVLSLQLISQGYLINPNSENSLRLDLLEALVKVENKNISNEMITSVNLQIVAQNGEKKFVKRFKKESIDKGVGNASPENMEQALNRLLEALLHDIHKDQELNNFINENF